MKKVGKRWGNLILVGAVGRGLYPWWVILRFWACDKRFRCNFGKERPNGGDCAIEGLGVEKGGQLQSKGVRGHQMMEFEVTQRDALSICVTVFGQKVIPKKDWEDDAGEFLHVGGAAVVEGRGGFLAYSAIGRD